MDHVAHPCQSGISDAEGENRRWKSKVRGSGGRPHLGEDGEDVWVEGESEAHDGQGPKDVRSKIGQC